MRIYYEFQLRIVIRTQVYEERTHISAYVREEMIGEGDAIDARYLSQLILYVLAARFFAVIYRQIM